MADMKISDLPAAPNVNDAQQFEVNDSGNSRSVTFGQIHGHLKNLFDNEYLGKNDLDPLYQGSTNLPVHTPVHWNLLTDSYPYTGIVNNLIYSNTSNGGPGSGHYYYVQQFFYSGSNSSCTQLAIPYTDGAMAFRYRYNGVWSPWKYCYDTSNFSPANFSLVSFAGQLPYSRISGAPSGGGGGGLPSAMGVGSWLLAGAVQNYSNTVSVDVGATVSGANIRYVSFSHTGMVISYSSLSGTWRNMGPSLVSANATTNNNTVSFFMRIA